VKLGIESIVENIKNKIAVPFEQDRIEIGPTGVRAPTKSRGERDDDEE
jgi:hypothetical protein